LQIIDNFKLKFSTDLYFKFRTIAVTLAVFLGFLGILLGISIFFALFRLGNFLGALGMFFARSFGILSLIFPVYLSYAAFILIDRRWRPERIFLLSACIFPFLTLAIGYAFIRDFEMRSAQYALLNFTGKTGFSLLIIFITVVETLLLHTLKNVLFKDKSKKTYPYAKRPYKELTLLPPPPVKAAEKKEEKGQLLLVEKKEQYYKEPVPEKKAIAKVEDETEDSIGVARALEEAEAAAAIHGEQVRKKNPKPISRMGKYSVPVDILNEYPDGEYWIIDQPTRDAAMALKETLEEFKIQAEVTGIRKGPVITMIEILPAAGVKLSRIVGLQDNIALRLAASSVRIVAPIPGKHAVGIEVPNAKRNIVSFREIIESELERPGKRMEIPVVMGKDITGEAQTVDLVQMPHLLIAGATGSGKSVCVNSSGGLQAHPYRSQNCGIETVQRHSPPAYARYHRA